MKKISVFAVDDHYMVIEGIYSLLSDEESIEWCGHATNGASCLAFLKQRQPDVILMDINLGTESGLDLCLTVRQQYPSVFIIGLSTFNQHSFIQRMMQNGASGYLLKNATKAELLTAINAVVSGKEFFSDEAMASLKSAGQGEVVLTRREKEVLELIADGLTNAQIAERLFISSTTVDSHRSHLLSKLEAKNTAELIKIAVVKKMISFE